MQILAKSGKLALSCVEADFHNICSAAFFKIHNFAQVSRLLFTWACENAFLDGEHRNEVCMFALKNMHYPRRVTLVSELKKR